MARGALLRTIFYALAFTCIQAVIVAAAALAQLPTTERLHDARIVRIGTNVGRAVSDASAVSAEDMRAWREAHDGVAALELLGVDGSTRVTTAVPPVAPAWSGPIPDAVHVGDVDLKRPLRDASGVVREAVVPFRDRSGRTSAVRVVADASSLDRALSRLWDRFALVLPASFVAAGLVSWLIVRQALSPLRTIADRVRRLRPGALPSGRLLEDAAAVDGEVVRLQASLGDAMARIEESHRAQSEFVANVAHELKTPIAVLLTEGQVVQRDDVSREELMAFRDSTVTEMSRLGSLVEAFLVTARTGHGRGLTRHETVFLPEVLVDSVQHTRRVAEERSVRVRPVLPEPEVCDGLELNGDPELLTSMLENLIRNAVKYSPPDAVVDVTLMRDAEDAILVVRDRGPGVPAHVAERLFDRYVQAGAHDGRSGGFGLGLSIAAGVARLHGGTISVRNRDDGGAEFTIRLPLHLPPPAGDVRDPAPPA